MARYIITLNDSRLTEIDKAAGRLWISQNDGLNDEMRKMVVDASHVLRFLAFDARMHREGEPVPEGGC